MAENILKREDGSQVKITANFNGNTNKYKIEVHLRDKGKRKWNRSVDTDSWEYRHESFPDGRERYRREGQLKHVSKDEIHEAMLKEWESLKPIRGDYSV